MKAIVTADWHFSRSRKKLETCANVVSWITSYCKNNNIGHIIVAGDVFHHKSILYSEAAKELVSILEANSDITFILLDGNHDLSESSEPASAISLLKHVPNVLYIGETQLISNILFIPFSKNLEQEVKTNSNPWLISHFGLNEAVLSSGISIVSNISMKDLCARYNTVLLGHYHKPQELSMEQTQVYYVGNPYQFDWGERNEEKRMLLVDFDSGTIDSIPTEGYPKHYVLEIHSEGDIEKVKKESKDLSSQGNFVVIWSEVKTNQIDTSDLPDVVIIDKSNSEVTNRGIAREMSLDEKLSRYLDIKEIPPESKDLYIDVAKIIISECESIKEIEG
jgi:DNA repair exonuclease SbcCD nuclease subunit